ncbi:cob(I)yrinic acid a,c-diamide adenosyltransferase [Pannonibacter phragmitetus]|uniref:cob(I)yrinic acid a,c-diamide adenosyltransferase n=1 Tax=Pannonibacter phragmitetus TaxID=121719 RepID=UPI003D2EFA8B
MTETDTDTEIQTEEDMNARHAEKMRKKKAARDKIMATKTIEKGLTIVHTGKGKGKSTAGFGMVFRSLGHGHRVGVVQFVKGRLDTGETHALERFSDLVTVKRMGEGFTWETQDRQRDIAAAQEAWDAAKEMITSGDYRMVLCDELNIVLRYDYLDIAEVVAFLKDEKPEGVHVVITGRNAKDELIEVADLVTEMEQVKHPFRSGVKPQAGVEY